MNVFIFDSGVQRYELFNSVQVFRKKYFLFFSHYSNPFLSQLFNELFPLLPTL